MPEVTISVSLRTVGADGITFASIAVVSDIPVSRKYKCYPLSQTILQHRVEILTYLGIGIVSTYTVMTDSADVICSDIRWDELARTF